MTSSGHESIGSFPSMHSLAKASPATSLIAETFTTTEQVRHFIKLTSSRVKQLEWLVTLKNTLCGRIIVITFETELNPFNFLTYLLSSVGYQHGRTRNIFTGA